MRLVGFKNYSFEFGPTPEAEKPGGTDGEHGFTPATEQPDQTNGVLPENANGKKDGNKQEEMLPDDVKKEKIRILKNIILVSVGFLFNFTSFIGLSRLQSVLHQDEGMGTICQAVLYACLVFSCLFLPKIFISKLGYKGSIIACNIGYVIWMASNGVSQWWSLLPASIIVGLAGGPLWTAQASYFAKLATRYAKLVGETQETIVNRFFGIFYMVLQMATIFGSLISSTALTVPLNATEVNTPEAALAQCGIMECPKSNVRESNVTNVNYETPGHTVIWTMVGVFAGVSAAGVAIIGIFMDKLPQDLEDDNEHVNFRAEIPKFLAATLKHWRHLPQILLMPLTMYSGIQQAYFNVEYTKSYISCALSISMVGYATMPYGFVNVVTSISIGWLEKHVGRIPLFLAGMMGDLAIQTVLYTWMPHPDQLVVFFIISGCWGFTDSIWQTLINALYGSIFTAEPEPAFANFRMFESIGFIMAFAYSDPLCTKPKTAVMTSMLLLGMSGYLATEFIVRRKKPRDIEDVIVTSSAKSQDIKL